MKINLTSVFVDDQSKALDFYPRVLGFEKKHDIPLGEFFDGTCGNLIQIASPA